MDHVKLISDDVKAPSGDRLGIVDPEDDLPPDVPGQPPLERLARPGQRQDRVQHRPDWPASISRAISTSWARLGSTMKKIPRAPASRAGSGARLGRDGDERPAPPEDAPGAFHRVPADGIQHDVHVAEHLLEPGRPVVDRRLDAQLDKNSWWRAEAVALTWAPRQRASWAAKTPTPRPRRGSGPAARP